MKTVCGNPGRTIVSSLVACLVWLVAICSFQAAEAATNTLYVTDSNSYNIPGDAPSTNLAAGYTTTQSAATVVSGNTYYYTLFATAPPANGSTRMSGKGATAGTYYSIGRIYYNAPVSGTAATIAANVMATFYASSTQLTDKFKFILRDYNPAAGAGVNGAQIVASAEYGSPNTGTTGSLVNGAAFSFGNADYVLPSGHYLEVEIQFKPATANNIGYFHCNSSKQSKIDFDLKFDLASSTTDANGTIAPSGTNTLLKGANQSYSITANGGYQIFSLSDTIGGSVPGAVGLTSYTYNVNNVSDNHTITVGFISSAGTFTIAPGAGGSIAYPAGPLSWAGPQSASLIKLPGTYHFTVTPDPGYGIDWVKVNNISQGVPQGQFAPFDIDVIMTALGTPTLSAQFIPYYNVSFSSNAGGVPGVGGSIITAAGASPQQVMKTNTINFQITPDNGYRILSITDNGVSKTINTTYSVANIAADHTIVVTFLPLYTISAQAGPNGTISPIGDTVVDGGSTRNFSISPNTGFQVSDVVVDGTSVGVVTSYAFTNISDNHTIAVSFTESPSATTSYCAIPPFVTTAVPPNVMLMLSVESPMEGAANPTVTCTGTPSSLNYSCTSAGLGAYDNGRNYYGYFESGKCYTYSGSGATGLFTPSGAATNHQCAAGTAWSGNMLNWATTLAVDAFRKAYTGGNRATDVSGGDTVILAATNDGAWFPVNPTISNAELYMPVAGANQTRTIKRQGAGIGFGVCTTGKNACTVATALTTSGNGETKFPNTDLTKSTDVAAVYSLRIKACSATGGTELRCNTTTNKPEGTIQKYMDKMRFALMSYANDNSQERDGGVLRANMKWVSPTITNGFKYHDATGAVATCATVAGCVNPEREVETDGTFRSNPSGVSGANSGVINYINKFGYTSGYKSYDPMGELYYEVVRYFKNLTPSVNKYCSGLTVASNGDGFTFYCASTKTTPVAAAGEWRDPTLYPCSQNFVIAINDANPWLDKRVPGSAFKANYGGSSGSGLDWCGSTQGACDADFLDGGVQIDVEGWTNIIGDIEGLTGKTGPYNGFGCEVDASGVCIGGFNSSGKSFAISKLGRLVGTPPGPGKENSYNVAGLAYYAHSANLRPDLAGSMHNLTTYMIDTQEPGGSMLVGPWNMLYLAAKYGGFTDKDNDGKPYQDSSCGGVSATPDPLCAEWDEDNDGVPDNYFFASDSSKVEASLNKAFTNMLNRTASGTAAAVANNKSGERGANMIQALFYPQWPLDKNIKWLGEVQALWYYLDPIINYSGIYEDTDQNMELNIQLDKAPGSDPFVTKAIWKGGAELHKRTTARNIYTLLDPTNRDLTNSANAFVATQVATLKPLLLSSALTDAQAQLLINYIRGTDSGAYRSRTVTNTYPAPTGTLTACWKLGDVINSTPQVQSSIPVNAYDQAYSDLTYSTFIRSNQYKANDVVYAGANDGMLHAFRLGQVQKIVDANNPFRIAGIIDDTGLGTEEWAFIPENALPYLKNTADQNYCHQYLVDGAPLLLDASLNRYNGCAASNYWDCPRVANLVGGALSNRNDYVPTTSSWKSVLIGSMGLGGASREGNCHETLSPDADMTNNLDCIKTPATNKGLSSYFALDTTNPLAPKQMWELSDANLPAADKGIGLTTSGVAVVRINAKTGSPPVSDKTKNGRWFAVFASGPTGSITTSRQFLGRSDQNLKIYVVDVNAFETASTFIKGTNYWVFDTGISYAFANSLTGAAMDLDRADSTLDGYYSDDVVYITYTKASLTGTSPPVPTTWNKGGILRLVTNNDPDPANWFVSTLVDNIGPITTSIGKLQDRNNKKLWVYFGEGRYFYPSDELFNSQRIYGVTDPCYGYDHPNTMGTELAKCPAIDVATLKDQTSTPTDPLGPLDKGWYITLDDATSDVGAERVVSDVTAAFNGIVFFVTFTPNTDICSPAGSTSLWAVNYSSGGVPPAGGLSGKAPLQTSSGGITMVDLASSFTQRGGRKIDAGLAPTGMAPKGRFPPLLKPRPTKQILHIQEQ
jgi:Tfp pilus tip-associated adhesin PilY1